MDKKLQQEYQRAYTEDLRRCLLFTRTRVPIEEVSTDTMKANIQCARESYEKIPDKQAVSLLLGDLNQLERKYGVEATK